MRRDFINSKVIVQKGDNNYVNFPCECILTNYEVSTKGDIIWAVFQKENKDGSRSCPFRVKFPTITIKQLNSSFN